MIFYRRHHRVREADLFEYRSADRGVRLRFLDLRGGQPARLVQNMVRNSKFADIVEQRARAERAYVVFRKIEEIADPESVYLGPPHVANADLVPGVDGARQDLHGGEVDAAGLADLFGFLLQPPDMDPVGRVAEDC